MTPRLARGLSAALTVAALAACFAPFVGSMPPCDASARLVPLEERSQVRVLAIGDGAECPGGAQSDVASLAVSLEPDALFALGDLAYPNGSLNDYLGCYAPSFGGLRGITRAVPGNHEYHTVHAGRTTPTFAAPRALPSRATISMARGCAQ